MDDIEQITRRTLDHYERNAQAFLEGTRDHDVSLRNGAAGCIANDAVHDRLAAMRDQSQLIGCRHGNRITQVDEHHRAPCFGHLGDDRVLTDQYRAEIEVTGGIRLHGAFRPSASFDEPNRGTGGSSRVEEYGAGDALLRSRVLARCEGVTRGTTPCLLRSRVR